MSPEVAELIANASPATPEELRAQAVSFAFGNCAIDNPAVTREIVEREARRLPLDQVLAQIHADAAQAPGAYLEETKVPDGGE